jgi:hypothetical protein
MAYRRFAAHAGITHEAVDVRAGVRARGAIHIQNVNSWHRRFKSWRVRCRGVAVSRADTSSIIWDGNGCWMRVGRRHPRTRCALRPSSVNRPLSFTRITQTRPKKKAVRLAPDGFA